MNILPAYTDTGRFFYVEFWCRSYSYHTEFPDEIKAIDIFAAHIWTLPKQLTQINKIAS